MSDQAMDKETEILKALTESIGRVDLDALRRVVASAPDTVKEFLSDAAKLFFYPAYYETRAINEIPPNEQELFDSVSEKPDQKKHEKIQKAGARKRHIWRSMIELLVDAGLTLSPATKKAWAAAALRSPLDAETVAWLMQKGAFSVESLAGSTPRHGGYGEVIGLMQTLEPEGPEEMALLEQLHAAGLLSGPSALFGVTDLACQGRWECARFLVSQGENPTRCMTSVWSIENDLGPIEAFVSSLSPRGSATKGAIEKTPEVRQERARGALAGLRRLVEWGASIEPQSQRERGTRFALAALAALLGDGAFGNERAVSREMIELLGPELVALGARPNDGHDLAVRLAEMAVDEDDCRHFHAAFATKWAVDQGLDFSAHAAWVQRALARRARDEKMWPLVEKFSDMGSAIALIGPLEPSPVKVLLESNDFERMQKFIDSGAPMNYVDESGESALHFLAGNATKAGLAQLDAFLKNPTVLALIGLGSQEEGHEGEQPLHRACAALNQKAIEKLLNAGADVNAQDAQGWTPLRHLLRKTGAKAQAKSLPAVKALIERGADPSIRDAKGRTPAQSAAAKAPLGALSELLQLRPEDIAGEAPASDTAKEKLRRRGGHGLSLAESVDLKHEMARAAENARAAESDEKPGGNVEKPPQKRRPRAL